MTILVDTREKWTQPGNYDKHIRKAFDKAGIEWTVQKLDVGDYMTPLGTVSVDRKQNLDEVATNLLNRADKARFWREVRKAHSDGIKLIILCEHGNGIESINDVTKWRSQHSQVSGRDLIREMIRLEMAYGVRWCFCDRDSAGDRIIKLLNSSDTI